jgi:hypothetical protein
MAEGINLLPEIAEVEVKRGVYRRKINIFALLVLAVLVAILLGFILYWGYLGVRAKTLSDQTTAAEKKISEQTAKEINQRALVGKLDMGKNFLTTALPYSVSMDKIIGIVEGIANLTSNTFDSKNLEIAGEVSDTTKFSTLVDRLNDPALSGTFGTLVLNSLTKGAADNPYKFDINFKFLKEGTAEGIKK